MQKRRFIQNVTIIVLAVAIIVMSVGYAAYITQLEINGTTTIEKASWNVHFTETTKLDTSTVLDEAITGPTLNDKSTALTFAVNLKLNDVYEFTTDVKNDGTLDAKLTQFTLTGTKGDATVLEASSGLKYTSDYLQYIVTWADGTELSENEVIKGGNSKKLKVSVKYVQPTDDSLLPTEDETYVFTLNMNFSQATTSSEASE